MRRSLAAASLLVAVSMPACADDPPARIGPEPMRVPPGGSAKAPPSPASTTGETGQPEQPDPDDAVALPERPRADPDIERALDLISASGLRFVDQSDEPDERPNEYTAEQFAGMLRTKWDWIGYDLTELDPWLDSIASRSFKSNLPYQVVLANGTTSEFRPWLDAQLHENAGDDGQ